MTKEKLKASFDCDFESSRKRGVHGSEFFAEYFLDPTPVGHRWRLETLRFTVNFVLEGSVFVAFFFPILNGMPFIYIFFNNR